MAVALLPREMANALMRVRFAWGADLNANPATWVWSDVTTDVWFSGPVTITPMGRGDWASLAQPAGCTFRLNNETGAYSKGPGSQVRDNTPVQVQVSLNNGGAWFTRFQGYVTGFPPRWDGNGKIPYVVVKANGMLRRLQNVKRIRDPKSAARRFYERQSPLAYWSLEDANGSTQAASALLTGSPMQPIVQSDSSGVKFGQGTGRVQPAYTGFEILDIGTSPLASFGEGGRLLGPVSFPSTPPTAWAVEFIGRTYAPTVGSDVVMLRIYTSGGTFAWWEVMHRAATGGVRLTGFDANGTPTVFAGTTFAPLDLHAFRVVVSVSGGTITASLRVTRVVSTGEGGSLDQGTAAGTITWPTHVEINPFNKVVPSVAISPSGNLMNDLVVGHLGVYATSAAVGITTTSTDPETGRVVSPWTGWLGESPKSRLTRLCAEEGVALTVSGTSNAAMGMQGVDAFLNLLRECEAADVGGVLYDGLGPGLGYVARAAKQGQTIAGMTLNGATNQFVGPFEPEDDDQRTVNLATVKRKNGSQATYEQVTGPQGTAAIGDYPTSPTVNVAADQQLYNLAAWITWLGTAAGAAYRYPTLNLDFGAKPSLLSAWLPSTPLGARIDVLNASSAALQHPIGDLQLILEGYAEKIAPDDYTVQANTSFYDPWIVDALNQTFRLELAGQTVGVGGITPGATSFSLATAAGHCLFTTSAQYPADFPLDLLVGGWPIHVTAASGGSSPQTLTISASPNTVTIPAGTPVQLLRPAALAL